MWVLRSFIKCLSTQRSATWRSLRHAQAINLNRISFSSTLKTERSLQPFPIWIQLLNLIGLLIKFDIIIVQLIFTIVVLKFAIIPCTLLWVLIGKERTWSASKVFCFLSDIHGLTSWIILVDTDLTWWSLRHAQAINFDRISISSTLKTEWCFQPFPIRIQLFNLIAILIKFDKLIGQLILAIVVQQPAFVPCTLLWILVSKERAWSTSKVFGLLSDIHGLTSWITLLDSDNVVTHWSLNYLNVILGDGLIGVRAFHAYFLRITFFLASELDVLVWRSVVFDVFAGVFVFTTLLEDRAGALIDWAGGWVRVFEETVEVEACVFILITLFVVKSGNWSGVSASTQWTRTDCSKINLVVILIDGLFFVFTLNAYGFLIS